MTLNIQSIEDEQRQLKVTVDVSEERVQRGMRQMARRLARDLHIPGFRPGKAPYDVVVRRVGEDALRAETIEEMTSEIFSEMLAELAVEPYGQPTLDELELKPFQMQFTVPLRPIIDLGDYRSIRMAQESVEVTEEAVDNALDNVRRRHEVVEPVERPSQSGDIVTVSRQGRYLDEAGEEQLLFDDKRLEILLDKETTFKDTDFVDHLIGLEVGDDAAFSLTFPQEYDDPAIAGLEVKFEITVLDVQKREVPELDDELAKLEGDYENLDELRARLRMSLEEQATEQARADLFDNMVSKIRENASLAYPPALIEAEIADRLEDLKQQVTRVGWEWEDYLRLQSQSEETITEAWREGAADRVERNLVLLQFVEDERLNLTKEIVDAAVDERVAGIEDAELSEQLRSYYNSGAGLERLRNVMLMDMIIDRLEKIADGSAPELSLLELSAVADPPEAAATAVEAEAEADLSANDDVSAEEIVPAEGPISVSQSDAG